VKEEKNMNLYRTILSESWKITWSNKYLWFFGLFAALLGGGEYDVIFKALSGETGTGIIPGWQRISETGIFSSQALSNIGGILKTDPLSLLIPLIALLVVLAISVFLIWLSIVSQAALVNNSAAYLKNKKVDFKKGLAAGTGKFWTVFGLNAGIRILIYILFLVIGLLAITASFKTIYIIAFIIFIPVALALSFIAKYAVAYAVIQGKNFGGSIKNGCRLFADNWLVSLEMAFILFLINILIGLGLILIILALTIPFLFLVTALYKLASAAGFWFIIAFASTLFLLIIAFVGAVLSSFQISAWTGLFVQLENKGGESKLVRMAEAARSKIA
jgi:hypothetical protein